MQISLKEIDHISLGVEDVLSVHYGRDDAVSPADLRVFLIRFSRVSYKVFVNDPCTWNVAC